MGGEKSVSPASHEIPRGFISHVALRENTERGLKQYIDMKEKGLSKGEFSKVLKAVGGLENLIDPKCKDQETFYLVKYLAAEDKEQKVFENQQLIKTPVVRNGNQATVGFLPEVWKEWK